MIEPFVRKAMYYETDKMAVVHHSNYIRWFEEARIYYLEEHGLPFEEIEKSGLVVPVLSVDVQYRKPVRFGETVRIREWMTKFTQLKFEITYEVTSFETGELLVIGKTGHCFVDEQMNPVRLKRDYKEIYDKFNEIWEIDRQWNSESE
ncbi:MAG: acyl-CoA thioesterase [Lachnospiraceae bacterium]|nr:acyl-CoA thioesterase [Lachnospiraceae bacterium]